jgi:hypothetical protein
MSAGKRNTSVVAALITSMTFGAVLLRGLEKRLVPGKPHFKGSTLLMAERALRVAEIEVNYVPPAADLDALGIDPDDGESICVISGDGPPDWVEGGPLVRVVVLGTEDEAAWAARRRVLLGALGTLNQASGQDLVPVRLAAGSDVLVTPELPAQAGDLRALLELKGIIQ